MAGQLLSLVLLLLAVSRSSSMEPTIASTDMITNSGAVYEPNPVTTGPVSAALNDNTPDDKVSNLINTKEPMTSPTITNGSEASPTSQEETSTSAANVTMMSTTSEDPSLGPFTLRPIIDRVTADLPVTSHEDNKTNDHETTSSSHPSGKTITTPKTAATKDPKIGTTNPKKPEASSDKNRKKLIMIVVIIVILILILATVLVALVRCKRRRGSQSFQSQSRSSKRQEVWAGQVPELADGKVMVHPMGMENGTTGNKPEPGDEQEMKTFISDEKKADSLVEMNEMGKGDALEEEKPLLEECSLVNEEPGKPPEAQTLTAV